MDVKRGIQNAFTLATSVALRPPRSPGLRHSAVHVLAGRGAPQVKTCHEMQPHEAIPTAASKEELWSLSFCVLQISARTPGKVILEPHGSQNQARPSWL